MQQQCLENNNPHQKEPFSHGNAPFLPDSSESQPSYSRLPNYFQLISPSPEQNPSKQIDEVIVTKVKSDKVEILENKTE